MLPARHNPFSTERVARALPFDPCWCGTSWEEILARLAAGNWRGLVAGPHGSGKTVFLDALGLRLEKMGFTVRSVLLNDNRPELTADEWRSLEHDDEEVGKAGGAVWLVDGAEWLRRSAWRRLRNANRARGGLVATRHRVVGGLPLLLETRATPAMLAAFLARLAPELKLSREAVAELHRDSGGNLREALWRCYDQLAGS